MIAGRTDGRTDGWTGYAFVSLLLGSLSVMAGQSGGSVVGLMES